MPDATTIEEQQLMELEEERQAALALEEARPVPKTERLINSGEAVLLLAFTGGVEILQWALDFIPYLGWILNVIIAFFVGLILYIWIKGKMAKGAPKKWYKAIFAGAGGSVIPIIPGYLGAIIWLILEDRQILKKFFGKIGEVAQKLVK